MTKAILIVEDEAVVALATVDIVNSLGYDVIGPAESCDEAMALAAGTPPALALVDIHIRGDLDGIETARRLRERHGCPIVFVTGQSDGPTRRNAEALNPIYYLCKPFTPDQLAKAIRLGLFGAE
ncbi:response regulator [Azospirillum sp. Vi22]|uniref:response regulator n=1 Tax=Azospirillum baldaniorum TaxID=1064539 RepID=UPI00157ACA56|nr:response regulator [Azospirillum baldaniorum]NUB07124.1 response regulator [Azospirillum baldaniorum]